MASIRLDVKSIAFFLISSVCFGLTLILAPIALCSFGEEVANIASTASSSMDVCAFDGETYYSLQEYVLLSIVMGFFN